MWGLAGGRGCVPGTLLAKESSVRRPSAFFKRHSVCRRVYFKTLDEVNRPDWKIIDARFLNYGWNDDHNSHVSEAKAESVMQSQLCRVSACRFLSEIPEAVAVVGLALVTTGISVCGDVATVTLAVWNASLFTVSGWTPASVMVVWVEVSSLPEGLCVQCVVSWPGSSVSSRDVEISLGKAVLFWPVKWKINQTYIKKHAKITGPYDFSLDFTSWLSIGWQISVTNAQV